MLPRLIFNCTVLIWLSFYEIATRKKKQPETTMIQSTFPVPSVSDYNKWTPEKLKKNHTFLNGMVFFSVFFFSRNNQTQEIVYSIFFCPSWWPTCCFCGCDSFDEWEKNQGYHSFQLFQLSSDGHSCSGLGFRSTSYNKSQNDTNTIRL